MVPEVGVEPTRTHVRQILSLLRLPFRHSGKETPNILTNYIPPYNRNKHKKSKKRCGSPHLFSMPAIGHSIRYYFVTQYGASEGAARYFAHVSQHLQRIIWKPAISWTVSHSVHLPGTTVTPAASRTCFALR